MGLSDARLAQMMTAADTWRNVDADTLEPIETARNEFAMCKQFFLEVMDAMREANAPGAAEAFDAAHHISRAHGAVPMPGTDEYDAEHETARMQAVAFAREAIDAHSRTADTLERINGDLLGTMGTASQTIRSQAAHIEELSSPKLSMQAKDEIRLLRGELAEWVPTMRAGMREALADVPELFHAVMQLQQLQAMVVAWVGDIEVNTPGDNGEPAVFTSATDRLLREGVRLRAARPRGLPMSDPVRVAIDAAEVAVSRFNAGMLDVKEVEPQLRAMFAVLRP